MHYYKSNEGRNFFLFYICVSGGGLDPAFTVVLTVWNSGERLGVR